MDIKKLTILAIIIAVVGGIAYYLYSFGGIETGMVSEEKEVRIGVIAPLTGETSVVGEPTVNAAKLAVDNINEKGGLMIKGKTYRVNLAVEDGKGSPEGSVNAAKKLINQENVVAIVGPQYSTNIIPVAEVADEAGVLLIGPATTNPEVTANKEYAFRVPFIDPFQGKALAQLALGDIKARKVAVLYNIADTYSRGAADVFRKTVEAAGGNVVAYESYTSDQEDLTTQLAKIKETQPEVLLLPNLVEELASQFKQIKAMNLDLVALGTDTWGVVDASAYQLVEGGYYSFGFAPELANEKTKQYSEKYQQLYGKEPDGFALFTYDAFGIVFAAIENSGSTNPDLIKDTLKNLSYEGVTGPTKYVGNGDPERNVVIFKIKSGKPEYYKVVEP